MYISNVIFDVKKWIIFSWGHFLKVIFCSLCNVLNFSIFIRSKSTSKPVFRVLLHISTRSINSIHFSWSPIWKLTVLILVKIGVRSTNEASDLYHIGSLHFLTVVQKTPFKKWVKIFRVQADTLREAALLFSAQKKVWVAARHISFLGLPFTSSSTSQGRRKRVPWEFSNCPFIVRYIMIFKSPTHLFLKHFLIYRNFYPNFCWWKPGNIVKIWQKS